MSTGALSGVLGARVNIHLFSGSTSNYFQGVREGALNVGELENTVGMRFSELFWASGALCPLSFIMSLLRFHSIFIAILEVRMGI